MKISVLTASFNQGAFIQETIESVRSQTGCEIEHIIQDNCSTDITADVLKKYPHLKVITEKDKGQSDALNRAAKAATGDVIGWLNSDDRYLPGCFKTVVEYFKNNPQCDVLYGDYQLIDEKGEVLKLRKEIPFDLFMLKYLHVLCIPSTATFFRRKIFDDGNFFDINYHYAMDYEFFLRLALKGYKFYHISALLADFRVHSQSKSIQQELLQKQEREKALLDQDEFLNVFTSPLREFIRAVFLFAARSKRTVLKLVFGAYFNT